MQHLYVAIFGIAIGLPVFAQTSDAEIQNIVGLEPGYYAYAGKCEQIRDATGAISPYVILWDQHNVITHSKTCKIVNINLQSGGWFTASYECVDNKTGEVTKPTQSLLTSGEPDQPKNTVQVGPTFVEGIEVEAGYSEPLVFCQPF